MSSDSGWELGLADADNAGVYFVTMDDLDTLTDAMHDPAFYQRDSAEIVAHNTKLAEAQAALDVAYARWMELDAG